MKNMSIMKLIFIALIVLVIYIAYNGLKSYNKRVALGKYGETEIEDFIKNSRLRGKLYKNIILEFRNGSTTEIDLVYVTYKKVYAIECKNYNAKIFGSEYDKSWTAIYKNGKKYTFYNPIKQNETHVNGLSNILGIDKNCIDSIVVFTRNADISNVHTRTPVIYSDRIVNNIEFRERSTNSTLGDATRNGIIHKLDSSRGNLIKRIRHIIQVSNKK